MGDHNIAPKQGKTLISKTVKSKSETHDGKTTITSVTTSKYSDGTSTTTTRKQVRPADNANVQELYKDGIAEREARANMQQEQTMKQLFEAFDKDGSGCLSIDELTALLEEMRGKELKKEAAAKLFDVIDADDDDKVSLEEFAHAYPSLDLLMDRHAVVKKETSTPQCNRPGKGVREASAKDAQPMPPAGWLPLDFFQGWINHGKPKRPMIVVFGKRSNGFCKQFAELLERVSKKHTIPAAMLAWSAGVKDKWAYGCGTRTEPYVSVLRCNGTYVPAREFFRDERSLVAWFNKHKGAAVAEPEAGMKLMKTPPRTPPRGPEKKKSTTTTAAAAAPTQDRPQQPPPQEQQQQEQQDRPKSEHYLTEAEFSKQLNGGKPDKPTIVLACRDLCGNCSFTRKALDGFDRPVLAVNVDEAGYPTWRYGSWGMLPHRAIVFPDGSHVKARPQDKYKDGAGDASPDGDDDSSTLLTDAEQYRNWYDREVKKYEARVAEKEAAGPRKVAGDGGMYLAPAEFFVELNDGMPQKATIVAAGGPGCGRCERADRFALSKVHLKGIPVLWCNARAPEFWKFWKFSGGGMFPFIALVRADGTHLKYDGDSCAADEMLAWYAANKGDDAEAGANALPASPLFLKGDGDPTPPGQTPQEAPLAAPAEPAPRAVPEPGNAAMTALEREVWVETDLARTDPKRYAGFIEAELKTIEKFSWGWGIKQGDTWTMLNEGPECHQEAVDALRAQKPLPPMTKTAVGLIKSSRDHCADTGPKGQVGHTGTDGSTSSKRMRRHGQWERTCGENIWYGSSPTGRKIVMDLIIDAGVPSRGHRKNIYNAHFAFMGVAVGDHSQFGKMCVCNMAGGYEDAKG